MNQEINWVKNNHVQTTNLLKQYLLNDLVNTIECYSNGFVHIGELFTNVVSSREFNYKNYISFQIKYTHNLYFFDFWRVDHYDWGGDYFRKNWIINHYSYIYKNGKLLRDKISFTIDDVPSSIECFNPSYPIYNMKKLKQEHFVEFNCTPLWIQLVNNNSLKKNSSQEKINKLFTIFSNLTETKNDLFYENTIKFNLA
jgi:hypothetical protein